MTIETLCVAIFDFIAKLNEIFRYVFIEEAENHVGTLRAAADKLSTIIFS